MCIFSFKDDVPSQGDGSVELPPEEMSTETSSIPLPDEQVAVVVQDQAPTENIEKEKTVESVQETVPNGNKDHEETIAKEIGDTTTAEGKAQSQDEVESAINEQEVKYWNAVKENPEDFTSWTYLLQFVEQEVYNPILFADTRTIKIP